MRKKLFFLQDKKRLCVRGMSVLQHFTLNLSEIKPLQGVFSTLSIVLIAKHPNILSDYDGLLLSVWPHFSFLLMANPSQTLVRFCWLKQERFTLLTPFVSLLETFLLTSGEDMIRNIFKDITDKIFYLSDL